MPIISVMAQKRKRSALHCLLPGYNTKQIEVLSHVRTSSETPVTSMISHAEASTFVHQYGLPHADLRFGLFNDAFYSL
jgi:hypothetical protein